MYNKILVPLDGSNFSEQVLPYAHVFADAYRAPVELLRITDPDARPPFWPPQADDRYLEEIGAQHFRSSVHVTTVAAIGKPAEVIVDHAKVIRLVLLPWRRTAYRGRAVGSSAASPAKSFKPRRIRCC